MISLKKNEQGFGIIEVVVIILVIVAIGAGGWYIYKHKSTSTTNTKTSTSSSNSSSSATAWRDSNITKEIASAGQTVVSQKQVTVSADVDWVDIGLKVAAGQHIWVTTKADGKWSGNPQLFPYSDANGLAAYPGGYRVDANANVESLIGFVGASPTEVPQQNISVGTPAGGPGGVTAPGLFEPGNTLKNFAATPPGEIWLRNNDNTNLGSDVGQQVAEVWITT